MKKTLFVFIFLSLFLLSGLYSSEGNLSQLPPQYKKWLEEEVLYIITPKEKGVFLALKTDRNRDLFIAAFWRHRDPNPLTDQNEFKDEHYKRIDYANRNFGGAGLPGWKTERGRIFIILGRPNSVESYEGSSSLYPTISWFYQEMGQYGLPDAFYVMFFKRYGAGDYRLYSPTMDGPQSLLSQGVVGQSGYASSYRELLSIDPNLAKISLSLVPSEPSLDNNPSLASDKLLFNIAASPQKMVRDEYAEKLLLYKDTIEVEYSTNYIDNDSLVTIIRDESGIFFVNYLISIRSLSLSSQENKYFTKLIINGNISDPGGHPIFQFERILPFELSQEQFAEIKTKSFAFQDMFPLIEGNYHLSLLLKNEASKEFTSIEKNISIPGSSVLQISPLILAYKTERNSSSDKNQPFKIGDTLFYPSIHNAFVTSDPLFLFFQIYGLSEELRKEASLEIAVAKEGEAFKIQKTKLSDGERSDSFSEKYQLSDLGPGNYKIRVSLLDQDMKEIIFEEEYFYVSFASSIPRPWLHSSIVSSSKDPYYANILGEQFLNKNDLDKARALLEKAYQENPQSLQFAVSYGHVLLKQKEFSSIIKILTPFQKEKNNEVTELLARSHHALGNYVEAIAGYKEYITAAGINYTILTLLGDCYYRAGNKEEALKAWEKSLELNPNQETIKKLVDMLKKEKEKGYSPLAR